MLLRHFIKEEDAENVYKLWYKTFNNTWPLSYDKFIEFIDGYIFKE
ncbi:hypothetical protein SAMN02746089_00595 [Caldanaerobius fijiensis DSM 17918]|uniref:Uncharacterized protein n=1 Tax=Caldanaerobius fijiensis DSM 17918 TaxID=1121256 RepID=A0A1M4VCZ0_9THEO|nr:hypothetical protein [Caldanaerobius fijiensis]SHE66819.1 hypothetical protein SAMN02746089_00595 [Caldanaerobius fijiensis DSM 17918]